AWSGTCQGAALSLFGLGEAPALSAWWWDGSLALPAEALQGTLSAGEFRLPMTRPVRVEVGPYPGQQVPGKSVLP
ncbi:MAG: hypothetical protein ACK5HY_15060, partial [Parahaliea sp.]